tara:strand:- start:727 stop:933 length:207 start_codon:yes stop_codon:yes gene_type:complete
MTELTKIESLQLEVEKLQAVLDIVKKDLLLRAEEDSYGVKVVGLSSSVWSLLKRAIEDSTLLNINNEN